MNNICKISTTNRAELTENGFESLETSEDVSNYENVNEEDTTFVVISTCGCAAGLARPAAVAVAEQNDKNQQIKNHCICWTR